MFFDETFRATAAFVSPMIAPATRHAKNLPVETATTISQQYRFRFAAKMGFDLDTIPFQFALQFIRKRGAKQHVDMQGRDVICQFRRQERIENDFLPQYFLAPPASDNQQSRRGIQQR